MMSLGNLMSGALDINSILQGLAGSGGNVIIVNAGGGAPELPEMEEAAMPPIPAPPMEAMPPVGPDVEEPIEDAAEGGVEEPADMMGAAKAALLKK
jgi:hypothetical protein